MLLNAPGINPKHRARLLVLAARTYLYFGDVEVSGIEANKALVVGRRGGATHGRPAGHSMCLQPWQPPAVTWPTRCRSMTALSR